MLSLTVTVALRAAGPGLPPGRPGTARRRGSRFRPASILFLTWFEFCMDAVRSHFSPILAICMHNLSIYGI